jgi:hypothetical protein
MPRKAMHRKGHIKSASKVKRKMQAYRMRIEVIDALNELTKKANERSNIEIPMVSILELIILHSCRKEADEILDLIKEK